MTKMLRFIQLLCEGHNLEMQQYCIQQPGSVASVNIWIEIVKYLNLFRDTPRLWRLNSRVMKQLLETITEGMQAHPVLLLLCYSQVIHTVYEP